MKPHLPLLATLLAGPIFTGLSCAPRKPTVAAAAAAYSESSVRTAVFRDVNAYRAKLGKPPLVRHPGLDRMAQGHSDFLLKNRGRFELSKTGNVSHLGFDGRAVLAKAKYGIVNLHENVAAGPRGASMARMWAASKAHEPNMRANWAYTGVGVAVAPDGTIFATQLFGSAPTSHRELRQKFGAW